MNFRRVSLLWKIWLSTSVALTAMFAVIGYLVQRGVQETATRSLMEEAQSSSKAYQALWEARAGILESLASVLSGMPATAKALQARDPEAVRSILSLWERAPSKLRGHSFLLLTDAAGEVITHHPAVLPFELDAKPLVSAASVQFPRQGRGFFVQNSMLHQVVLNPLYEGGSLSGVLIAGFSVNHQVALDLKASTGRSEFIFVSRGQVFGSTMNDRATGAVVRNLTRDQPSPLVSDGLVEYVPLGRELIDLRNQPVGSLYILRSFEETNENVARLRRRIFFIWEGAIILGLLLTYLAVERIVKPVKDLDRAASEVAMQNYDFRVSVESDDELGRLASTFNKMCESLQSARAELIRRERVATIGRLASSIVHDLRNPLAAIYGGSEMLVDTQPRPDQTRRIAENIYRASRRIQELLDDLVRVTRGKTNMDGHCSLRELVQDALSSLEPAAQTLGVKLDVKIDPHIEVMVDRPRVEGVFVNLVQNALDVMPNGGEVRITASSEGSAVMMEVADTGPGIAYEIRGQLFQPFVSHGKKNGLGLGLALARQTMLDHGGDLWASADDGKGARFILRLPRAPAA
jgi:signal transduction histidine kinase